MKVCQACGHENSDTAKFCEECATPLAAAEAPREQRKTVTVLFSDMAFRKTLKRALARYNGMETS